MRTRSKGKVHDTQLNELPVKRKRSAREAGSGQHDAFGHTALAEETSFPTKGGSRQDPADTVFSDSLICASSASQKSPLEFAAGRTKATSTLQLRNHHQKCTFRLDSPSVQSGQS